MRIDRTELRAGVATFLTMAYILSVNPAILSEAGLPEGDVFFATAAAAAIATLVMGLWARYPFALAPGMGLNVYFTYGIVLGLGVSWQLALGAVFLEGILFLGLTFLGVRTAVVNAIPATLKLAITAGIGLFLALIGLSSAGIVEGAGTELALGQLTGAGPALALAGLLICAVLFARRTPGAILIGIAVVTAAAWLLGVAPAPEGLVERPSWPHTTFMAFDLRHLFTAELLTVTLAFLFVDFLDTAGTLVGVGQAGGFLDENGELPRADRAFTADAVGTVVGAMLGTSTVTSYIESATGVEEGGRTGATAVVVAVLFLLSLFLAPLFIAVPAVATAPALVMVGALMMRPAADIEWRRLDLAVPAFLTIALMPFTRSIANGIAAGVVAYAALALLTGRRREVHPVLWALAALLLVYYAFFAP